MTDPDLEFWIRVVSRSGSGFARSVAAHQYGEAPIYRMVQKFWCQLSRCTIAYLAAAAFLVSAGNGVNAVLIAVAEHLKTLDVKTER